MIEPAEFYEGQKVCCTRSYFRQHYGKDRRGYLPVNCGHCRYPRLKTRKPNQNCEYWKPKKNKQENKQAQQDV